jgi:glucoamylase
MIEIVLKKLIENIKFSKKPGLIIASPSDDPPYKYHWIRDSALVMRVIIDMYQKTQEDKYLKLIFDYIESEDKIQNLNTLTGLGEPKIKIDGTCYNEPWGRPQNDGPALRGINMIRIYKILKDNYESICNKIIKNIIIRDINYIIENYKKVSFDLWEEIIGWHFYTRVVQIKFIKEYINLKNELDEFKLENICLEDIYNVYLKNLEHHNSHDDIISSFNKEGNIIRHYDASILLCLNHVEYDIDIMKISSYERVLKVANNLLISFRNKYDLKDLNLIGRYEGDKYYGGQTWIICSLALVQFYKKLLKLNKYNYFDKYFNMFKKKIDDIINEILSIDSNLDIAEQYNPITKEQISAKKLTWNYSELYFTLSNN